MDVNNNVKEEYLVTFESNYADEFDVYGFIIIERKKWEQELNAIKEAYDRDEMTEGWYFGTNEYIDIPGDFESFKKLYKVTPINNIESMVLKSHFGDRFGHFPYLSDLLE